MNVRWYTKNKLSTIECQYCKANIQFSAAKGKNVVVCPSCGLRSGRDGIFLRIFESCVIMPFLLVSIGGWGAVVFILYIGVVHNAWSRLNVAILAILVTLNIFVSIEVFTGVRSVLSQRKWYGLEK